MIDCNHRTYQGRERMMDVRVDGRDEEIVARTLAAQSTGGVCQVFDADLAWQDWVDDARALIKGENE